MTAGPYDGLFVAEGSSDMPIADIVERLFFERGVEVRLRKPDFSLLGKVPKDVRSRLQAGERLADQKIDLVVVHRDADNAGTTARKNEISNAAATLSSSPRVVPVIPVRMTEAWLILDEESIRFVAGNPRGRSPLGLPNRQEAERHPDPKHLLSTALLQAAEVTGRRRERLSKRFFQHRRQLLERLDPHGPVTGLTSWQMLLSEIDDVCSSLIR